MSKEMVISANRHETRVAVLDNDQLVEVFFQRANEYSLAGSIHKGRVTRVLPGMQSAFVDLGLERDTFLYVSDFLDEHDADFDKVGDKPSGGRETRGAEARGGGGGDRGEREARGGEGRGDREGRDRDRRNRRGDRSQQQRSVASVSAEPAAQPETIEGITILPAVDPQDGPAAGVEAAPAAQAPVQGSTPAQGETRPADGKDGKDRHRRGRRRRGRGGRSGFPESKYAAPGSEGSEAPQAGETEDDLDVAEGEEAQDAPVETSANPSANTTANTSANPGSNTDAAPRVVLPGESLAKYRNAPPSAAPAEKPHAAAVFGKPATTKPASATAKPILDELDVPLAHLPDNAVPDVPKHEVATPVVATPVVATPLVAEPVLETSHAALEAVGPVMHMSAGAHVVEEPSTTKSHDDDEADDQDIRSMIFGSAGISSAVESDGDSDDSVTDAVEQAIDDAQAAAEAEADAAHAAAEAAVDAAHDAAEAAVEAEINEGGPPNEPADSSEQNSGVVTAEVREQGGRFPHRMSRRRRRGRGGERGPNGAAPAGAPVAEGAEASESEDALPLGESEEQIISAPVSDSQEGSATEAASTPDQPREPRPPRPEHRSNGHARGNAGPTPSISDLLKEGQEIIVQIAKEPLGQKGARITSHVALPGRFVVYMPTLEHMGVSRKIASDEERHRLKKILQAKRPGPVGGFITRTAAEGRTDDEIAGDMEFLYKLWQDIRTKAEKRPAPMLLHHDLDIVQRILRDQLADDFKAIWIDNEEMYENILRFVERFQPALMSKVKMYTREAPIFDAFNITQELEKALRPKVWLKSGGYIVINQTEALVAIDINTGKYVGKSARLEDTIVKTNIEAVQEIVRQIRLRDLGGIIVVDFIDMDERKNRQKVMQALEEAMRVDRAPYKILQFNDFGLVAITRKRVKQSLERTLCSPCSHCEGAGYLKSVQTVIGEILTEARKLSSHIEGKDVMLRVHPDVAKVIKSHQNKYLEELEEILRKPVLVKSDPLLHSEKFDLG